tara:strand:+ start:19007 stop:20044 length:1038 start_codon:yes stop_codon:yes gene_type:complete
MNIDTTDTELLNILQSNFPLDIKPFNLIGKKLNISESEVIERIQNLKDIKYIRQISAIFDTRSMKYKSSLIAMSFDEDKVDDAASIINSHPGITHNYKRNHYYNLWFTLAVPPNSILGLEKTVEILADKTNAKSTRILPTLKLFKIGVKLDMTGKDDISKTEDKEFYGEENISTDFDFTEEDIRIIKEVQEDFPLVSEPFSMIANKTEISTDVLIERLIRFRSNGIMRRVAAILHHRKAGFRANAMGVWDVPIDKIEDIAPKMAAFKSVSHCYRRPTYPDWPYSLFTMIHGRSPKDCNNLIKKLSEISGIEKYDALYSSKEYKKTRLKFFSQDQFDWEKNIMGVK